MSEEDAKTNQCPTTNLCSKSTGTAVSDQDGQEIPAANNEDSEIRRSKTLKQFGYVAVGTGTITIFATLVSFITYKHVWHTLLGQLFSGMFLIPLGVLSIMSGTDLEDQCHVITTNLLSAAVACIEAGNILLCSINIENQMEALILLLVLICFSAVKGVLGLAMMLLSSRYACQFYMCCCHKDEMNTNLL